MITKKSMVVKATIGSNGSKQGALIVIDSEGDWTEVEKLGIIELAKKQILDKLSNQLKGG